MCPNRGSIKRYDFKRVRTRQNGGLLQNDGRGHHGSAQIEIINQQKNDLDCMLEKHAYLILAHKSDYVLNSLLRLIDDERNDIFIHMDKRNRKYNESKTCSVVKKATIKHCERWKCAWGGYSLVKAELSLLELATKSGNYSYYHLLSGQDLPIKSQDEIHNFFASNYGKEVVQHNRWFCQIPPSKKDVD